jgi:hypothetical protein
MAWTNIRTSCNYKELGSMMLPSSLPFRWKGRPPDLSPLEGTTPSCCMRLIWSGPPQCSAILPFAKLSMSQ